jgi:hypothetical protein
VKDILVMEDLDQIKCISQPYRINILEAFEDQPGTAKQISERLGEPHAKVNYHLKEMLKHNILDLVEEVVKLGIVEKYYLPVAKRFVVHSSLMKITDEQAIDSVNQYRLMIFDTTSQAFYKALEMKAVSSTFRMNMLHDIYLTDEDVAMLQQQIGDVMRPFEELRKENDPGAKRYVATNLIVPDPK